MRRKENLSPELNENYKRSAQSKTVVILVENRYLTSGYRIKEDFWLIIIEFFN